VADPAKAKGGIGDPARSGNMPVSHQTAARFEAE
jgi:hypothetical protein